MTPSLISPILQSLPIYFSRLSCSPSRLRILTSQLHHQRVSTIMTSTTLHNSNTDPENGQVKIHSNKPKTQAELEKEKWQEAHRIACEGNRKMYIDPKTGYSVMTELLHRRRGYCCGNACRHCPYNNENVGVSPEVKKSNIEKGKQRRKEIEAKEGKPVWADDLSDDTYSD